MIRTAFIGLVALATVVQPALAQQPPSPPNQAAPAAPPPSGAPSNPNLTVATVTMQGGTRISQLIGSQVFNDQNQKVGSVDDLILKDGNRIVMAIISVGGFLGIGNKLVAVPYEQIHVETNKNETKVTFPGASKDALNSMATFTFGG